MTLLTKLLPVMALVGGVAAPQVDLIGLGGSLQLPTWSFVGAQTVRLDRELLRRSDRVLGEGHRA